MKREADTLRTNVRELERELEQEGSNAMPMNEFAVTNYNDRVVSLRLFLRKSGEEIAVPMNVTSQQACELAAWLLVCAGLGEHMSLTEARDYFDQAYREALGS